MTDVEASRSTDPPSPFIADARPTAAEYFLTTTALVQPFVIAATLLLAERVLCGVGPSRTACVLAVVLGTTALGIVLVAAFVPAGRTFSFSEDALTIQGQRSSVTVRRADVAVAISVGSNVILATKAGMYLPLYLPPELDPLRSRLLGWCDCPIETRSLFATNFFSTSWLSASASAVALAAPHPLAVRATFAVAFAASLLGWLIDIAASPVALRRQKRTNLIIAVAFSLVAGTIFSRI